MGEPQLSSGGGGPLGGEEEREERREREIGEGERSGGPTNMG